MSDKPAPATLTLTREDDHTLVLTGTYLPGDDGTRTAVAVRRQAEDLLRFLALRGLIPSKKEHGTTPTGIVAILTFDGVVPPLKQPGGGHVYRDRPLQPPPA